MPIILLLFVAIFYLLIIGIIILIIKKFTKNEKYKKFIEDLDFIGFLLIGIKIIVIQIFLAFLGGFLMLVYALSNGVGSGLIALEAFIPVISPLGLLVIAPILIFMELKKQTKNNL